MPFMAVFMWLMQDFLLPAAIAFLVMSICFIAIEQLLQISGLGDLIEITPYLTKLCESLSGSMIGEIRPAKLVVTGDAGARGSAAAVSLGLIVTELVINALKYAFPDIVTEATIIVRYEENDAGWKLSVTDNDIGKEIEDKPVKGGLGTSLVNVLANQLDAKVTTTSGPHGMSIAIAPSAIKSLAPLAA